MNIKILGSSSAGNCYIIKTSEEILLLECGIHYKAILKALDFDLSKVAGCLISHEHKDHSKSVHDLIMKGIDIYSSAGTLSALNTKQHRSFKLKGNKQYNIGSFIVMPFDIQHDAAEPFGFLIYHKEFGKLLFATDTYYIKYKFKDLAYIMLECNYSIEILQENLDSGNLHPALKKRLLTSHFSLANVKKFLLANDLSKTKEIMLLHLSAGNSNAEQFKNDIEKLTGVPVRIC